MLSVEAALGLMISFAILVVTIIFGILALVLDNKNNRSLRGQENFSSSLSYHAGAAISTGLKVLAYFRPLSPYRSGARLRNTRSLAPGNLCMPKYAPYDHLSISRLLYCSQ